MGTEMVARTSAISNNIRDSAVSNPSASYSYQAPVVAQKIEPEEDELEKYLREKREADAKKAAESAFDEQAYSGSMANNFAATSAV